MWTAPPSEAMTGRVKNGTASLREFDLPGHGNRRLARSVWRQRTQLRQFLGEQGGRVRGKDILHPGSMARMPRAAERFIATPERSRPVTIDRGV
jgi:hypothetical protein